MITKKDVDNFLTEFMKNEYPDNFLSYTYFEAPNQSNFVRIHYINKNGNTDYIDKHWLILLTYIFKKQKIKLK